MNNEYYHINVRNHKYKYNLQTPVIICRTRRHSESAKSRNGSFIYLFLILRGSTYLNLFYDCFIYSESEFYISINRWLIAEHLYDCFVYSKII